MKKNIGYRRKGSSSEPRRKRSTPNLNRLEQRDNNLEPSFWVTFERAVFVFTLLSICLGAWAFYLDLEDRQLSRRVATSSLEEFTKSETARRQAALVDAWSLLSTLTPGNSGKREAIELISNEGISLEGIDLSCHRMGGGWDEEERNCMRPVFLVDLVLGRPGEIDGETVDGRFRGNLTGANLQGANLTGTILTDAYLGDVNFSGANLFAADLSNSGISGADFRGAQLTGTNFEGVRPPISTIYPNHGALFEGSWAWSHDPPIGLVGVEVRLCNRLPGNDFSLRPSNC